MFEMKRALLAYQHHVVPNRSERELFSKHSDRKLFFFMDIFEHMTVICGA